MEPQQWPHHRQSDKSIRQLDKQLAIRDRGVASDPLDNEDVKGGWPASSVFSCTFLHRGAAWRVTDYVQPFYSVDYYKALVNTCPLGKELWDLPIKVLLSQETRKRWLGSGKAQRPGNKRAAILQLSDTAPHRKYLIFSVHCSWWIFLQAWACRKIHLSVN